MILRNSAYLTVRLSFLIIIFARNLRKSSQKLIVQKVLCFFYIKDDIIYYVLISRIYTLSIRVIPLAFEMHIDIINYTMNNQIKEEKNQIRILLVEDDLFNARVYRDGFERQGFLVDVAADGEEALHKVTEQKPDIVLLDLILGQKSGFTILEEMKRNEKLRMIPVMILSDLAQESDIEKGKKLGAIDYLIKSDLSLKEVIERVKAYFSTI